MTDILKTWPADIVLVVGDGPLHQFDQNFEVTWCHDRIGDADVKYLRHDLVDQKINDLHRSIAAATLHAEQGWARYEEANTDRNAVRAERVQMVARIAELEADIAWQRSVTDAARQTQADLLARADGLEALLASSRALLAEVIKPHDDHVAAIKAAGDHPVENPMAERIHAFLKGGAQ